MKKLIAMAGAVIFVLGLTSPGFAAGTEKCEKCHKGEKSVNKMIEKKKIATAADLKKTLREGPKAGIHKIVTDDELKSAAEALKLE